MVYRSLMLFFSKMRRHEKFEELVKACGDWWMNNKPESPGKKRVREEDEDEQVPDFLELTEMMGV